MRLKGIKIQRPSEKTVRILKMIGIGVLMLGIGAVPPPWALGKILKELSMADTEKNRRWAKRRIYEVRHRGYVRADRDRYELTEMAHRFVEEQKLQELKVGRQKRWDGEWHVVAFDIPQEKKSVRIAFVRHLQRLGLVLYQRSVWIHAFSCEDEVRTVANFYRVLPHVSFIIASRIDGSLALRKHFRIFA